ncbi:MAG: tetratricopeptide repeat protein [Pirellulales bacterium]|nr:tetratricopeptide repeat protein [Pirellulales bacterium]
MLRTLLFAAVAACCLWIGLESAAEPIDPGSLSTTAETSTQMKELVDARERFQNRDYAGALALLKEAAAKNPDLPPAHVNMAILFAEENNLKGLRSALEQAVVEAPDDPQAYIILGKAALSERRLAEAGLLFEKAASLLAQWNGSAKRKDALTPQLYGGLAAVAEARGEWAKAREQLDALLKLAPTDSDAWVRLAQCLFREKDVPGAMEKLQQAAKYNTEMLPPQAIMAQWFARSNDQKNAAQWFVEALKAAPNNPQVRLVAAQWAWELGKLDEAEKQADAALQLDPNYYMAKILRGIIALFRKDYKTAEMYFESATLQSPKDFAASNNLALALAEQDDEAKRRRALEYAENNVRQHPRSPDAYSTYGWVLYKLGRLDDAYASLRKSISGGQFRPETAYYLARVLADRGQDADAIKFLQAAVQSPTPFSKLDEAKTLLEQLKASQPTQNEPLPDLPPLDQTPPPGDAAPPPKK